MRIIVWIEATLRSAVAWALQTTTNSTSKQNWVMQFVAVFVVDTDYTDSKKSENANILENILITPIRITSIFFTDGSVWDSL